MGMHAFSKWGIDFVGPIDPPTNHSHAQYIIVAIDYMPKWEKSKATPKNDAHKTTKFLYENIFTRYDLSIGIMSNRGLHFLNKVIEHVFHEFMVIHNTLTPYHPQAH